MKKFLSLCSVLHYCSVVHPIRPERRLKKEDLEKEIPTHKMWDDDNPAVDKAVMSQDAAAYAFDFQTYFILQERLTHYLESNTIAKTKEYSEWRTDRINKEKIW